MTLNVRNPRAAELARKLATLRGTTMTDAIIGALEAELQREQQATPLRERLLAISRDLVAKAGPNRREVTKEDIDAMWER